LDPDQRAKEGRFARVRIADQGDAAGGHLRLRRSHSGRDEHADPLTKSEADFAPRHADDTGISRPEHYDLGSFAQTEFFETMDELGPTDNAADMGRLAGFEEIDRDRVGHEGVPL
jgi:hypothetical protein